MDSKKKKKRASVFCMELMLQFWVELVLVASRWVFDSWIGEVHELMSETLL